MKNGLLEGSETVENLETFLKGKFKLTKLPERIILNHLSFSYWKNHFANVILDRKFSQLIESRIDERLVKNPNNKEVKKSEDDEPAVSDLEILSVKFQIWLLFLVLSYVSFCLELSFGACKRILRRFLIRKIMKVLQEPQISEYLDFQRFSFFLKRLLNKIEMNFH